MSHFSIRFYTNVTRHHETTPCDRLPTAFGSVEDAERAAVEHLAAVRLKHGTGCGYAIQDETGYVVHIGPGLHDD